MLLPGEAAMARLWKSGPDLTVSRFSHGIGPVSKVKDFSFQISLHSIKGPCPANGSNRPPDMALVACQIVPEISARV
jgi:hypothetical protein